MIGQKLVDGPVLPYLASRDIDTTAFALVLADVAYRDLAGAQDGDDISENEDFIIRLFMGNC